MTPLQATQHEQSETKRIRELGEQMTRDLAKHDTEAIMEAWTDQFIAMRGFPATETLFRLYLQTAYIAGAKAMLEELGAR